jgi:hypothetical protein
MQLSDISLVLLAGNPKCLDPGPDGSRYIDYGFEVAANIPFPKVVLVGSVFGGPSGMLHCEAGGSLLESMRHGATVCTTPYILFLATDITASPTDVKDFLRLVEEKGDGAAVYAGISPLSACRKLNPHARTHLYTRHGAMRMASIYLVSRAWLDDHAALLRQVLEQRKSPVKVAGLVLRYAASSLIAMCRKQGQRSVQLVSVSPRLAVDYDPPSKVMM